MSPVLCDAPGFEEALRALYRADRSGFLKHSELWPDDLRAHARTLANGLFEHPSSATS